VGHAAGQFAGWVTRPAYLWSDNRGDKARHGIVNRWVTTPSIIGALLSFEVRHTREERHTRTLRTLATVHLGRACCAMFGQTSNSGSHGPPIWWVAWPANLVGGMALHSFGVRIGLRLPLLLYPGMTLESLARMPLIGSMLALAMILAAAGFASAQNASLNRPPNPPSPPQSVTDLVYNYRCSSLTS